MKWKFGVFLICLANSVLGQSAPPSQTVYEVAYSASPIAVVELFTSQGCSSCPPADKLVEKTVQKYMGEGHSVYGLSFHVSYWNHQGWTDPYSSEQFTDRQKNYVNVKHFQTFYTPQVIVNGLEELVGSNAKRLKEAIDFALSNNPYQQIRASAKFTDEEVIVSYEVNQRPKGEVINFAFTESNLSNEVLRGENKGKLLSHFNVVRKFEAKELRKKDDVSIRIRLKDYKNMTLILYTQDKKTLNITAATKIDFNL